METAAEKSRRLAVRDAWLREYNARLRRGESAEAAGAGALRVTTSMSVGAPLRAVHAAGRPGSRRQDAELRAKWTQALEGSERAVREWEAVQQRVAVFRRIAADGWLLDDRAFALHRAERRREMRAAADRGDVEFFRSLD